MNAPLKTDALPQWRLDDLYAGRDDPRIEADITAAKAANDALIALEGQFVGARKDATKLGELLARGVDLYEQTTNLLWSVGAYASLLLALHLADAAALEPCCSACMRCAAPVRPPMPRARTAGEDT